MTQSGLEGLHDDLVGANEHLRWVRGVVIPTVMISVTLVVRFAVPH